MGLYKEFCELSFIKEKNKVSKFLWFVGVMLFAGIFIGSINSFISQQRKYPSKRYRRVVKEGILWDSVEYHER